LAISCAERCRISWKECAGHGFAAICRSDCSRPGRPARGPALPAVPVKPWTLIATGALAR